MKAADLKHRSQHLLAVAALALAAFSNAEEVFLDRTVALVDNNVIMQSELDARLDAVMQQFRGQPNAPSRNQIAEQVLERLVLERLQLDLAERNGTRPGDAEVNQAMQRIAASRNMTLEQYIDNVHLNGGSLADLRREIRDQIILSHVHESIKRGISVDLQEISAFMESEEGQSIKSPELQLGHILLPLSAGADKQKVALITAQAEKLRQQLVDGADFRQMAVTKSVGQKALDGGDLGWRRPAIQLPQLLAVAVQDLQPGDISQPIRSDAGIHIFKVYDRRGGEQQVMLQQHNVRHILMTTNAVRDDEATYNQLMTLRQRIADGEEFAALAKEFSEDPGSKQSGGELGWQTVEEQMLVTEFLQMMSSVDLNQVSYPFHTEHGWHILEVTERREKDFGNQLLTNNAANAIRDRKFEQELEIWLQELRDNAYVELKL